MLTCGTVNRYAGGAQQLRVGAATACPPAVSAYSSRLADGAAGDVLAVADRSAALPGIVAPGMRGAVRQFLSGTSLAAPQVTRWLAVAAGQRPADRAGVIALARASGQALDATPLIGAP